MESFKNLIFGLLTLVSLSGTGQEIPENYFKTDTVIEDNKTTITLYDSLNAPIYEETKYEGNTKEMFFEYTPEKHKIKEKVMKINNSEGIRTETGYLFYKYDKSGENEILKKQYSYSRNFAPNVFVIDKKRYKKNKIIKEKKFLKYFPDKIRKRKSKYHSAEDGSFTKDTKIKEYKNKKFISKKRIIQYYGKDGKFLKYKEIK